MKEGWKRKKLGDVCRFIGGGTPSKKKEIYYTGAIPWATVRDMNCDIITKTEFNITNLALKNSSSNIINKGNVIIATRVGLGKVCIAGQDIAINQDLKGVIPIDPNILLNKYIFYYFNCIKNDIATSAHGFTVYGINLDLLKSFIIPTPQIAEQHRIVSILDNAFEALSQAKTETENNLARAKELFQSELNRVFDEKGEGWEDKKLGDLCSVIQGQSPPGNTYNNNGIGIPFYQGKKEFTDKFIDKPTVWTTKITKISEKNDILMSVRAPVGPINLNTQKICIGRGLAAIRIQQNNILNDYLVVLEKVLTY
jgi:type I restriction enzyme S subunit